MSGDMMYHSYYNGRPTMFGEGGGILMKYFMYGEE